MRLSNYAPLEISIREHVSTWNWSTGGYQTSWLRSGISSDQLTPSHGSWVQTQRYLQFLTAVFSFSFLFEYIQCAVFFRKKWMLWKENKRLWRNIIKLGDMNGKFFSLVKKNYNWNEECLLIVWLFWAFFYNSSKLIEIFWWKKYNYIWFYTTLFWQTNKQQPSYSCPHFFNIIHTKIMWK